MNLPREVAACRTEPRDAGGHLAGTGRQQLPQLVHVYRYERQSLTHVVMQLASNPRAFLFLRVDQPAADRESPSRGGAAP